MTLLNLKKWADLVHLEQTLFGLPWALSGAIMPYYLWSQQGLYPYSCETLLWKFVWIGAAFVTARISGMTFNRWIDAEIDRKNPRTVNRLVARGAIKQYEARLFSILSLVAFIGCCFALNKQCFYASPFAAFLIWAYSYTKRFTFGCHFVLGMILGLSPLFGWMAMADGFSFYSVFLSGSLLCSIAASDILYSLGDREFDKRSALCSVPVYFGIKKSILIAKLFHLLAWCSLIGFGIVVHFSYMYFLGTLWIGGVILYLYHQVHRLPPDRLAKPAFQFNATFALSVLMTILVAWIVEFSI